jgi:hypothetical protein
LIFDLLVLDHLILALSVFDCWSFDQFDFRPDSWGLDVILDF